MSKNLKSRNEGENKKKDTSPPKTRSDRTASKAFNIVAIDKV
jgi:hypothetical protein